MKQTNLNLEFSSSCHKQQGAVLLISLMILLVLTLLGVSSLNGSLLEEKMAANAQTSTTIFQTAESAIRATHDLELKTPGVVVDKAINGTIETKTENYTLGDVNSNTLLVYKKRTSIPNYSADFVAHRIEVIGTASKNGIQESNTQGFDVYPLPAL